MIKNKRLLVVVLLLCLLLLVSCSRKSGAATRGAPTTPFLGGTSALTINFEKDSPPPEVTDDESFAFNTIVRLHNEGETFIERNDVKVNLIGFDPADFGLTFDDLRDVEPEDDLQSKKRDAEGNTVEGTTTFVTFPKSGSNFVPSRFLGNTQFTYRADVCYLYKTEAQTKVCGLRDMINVRDDAICRPTETKTTYSSSAPVQVTNFRQSVVGRDKISFSFDVVLSSNVDIFWSRDETTPSSGFDAACPRDPRFRREVENSIEVELTEIPVDPVFTNLKCGGLDNINKGVIKLVDGRRTITCTVELIQDRNDFEKVVGINLKYNVLDNKETTLLIKHLSQDFD